MHRHKYKAVVESSFYRLPNSQGFFSKKFHVKVFRGGASTGTKISPEKTRIVISGNMQATYCLEKFIETFDSCLSHGRQERKKKERKKAERKKRGESCMYAGGSWPALARIGDQTYRRRSKGVRGYRESCLLILYNAECNNCAETEFRNASGAITAASFVR